jgi:hypothetical protein
MEFHRLKSVEWGRNGWLMESRMSVSGTTFMIKNIRTSRYLLLDWAALYVGLVPGQRRDQAPEKSPSFRDRCVDHGGF